MLHFLPVYLAFLASILDQYFNLRDDGEFLFSNGFKNYCYILRFQVHGRDLKLFNKLYTNLKITAGTVLATYTCNSNLFFVLKRIFLLIWHDYNVFLFIQHLLHHLSCIFVTYVNVIHAGYFWNYKMIGSQKRKANTV